MTHLRRATGGHGASTPDPRRNQMIPSATSGGVWEGHQGHISPTKWSRWRKGPQATRAICNARWGCSCGGDTANWPPDMPTVPASPQSAAARAHLGLLDGCHPSFLDGYSPFTYHLENTRSHPEQTTHHDQGPRHNGVTHEAIYQDVDVGGAGVLRTQ